MKKYKCHIRKNVCSNHIYNRKNCISTLLNTFLIIFRPVHNIMNHFLWSCSTLLSFEKYIIHDAMTANITPDLNLNLLWSERKTWEFISLMKEYFHIRHHDAIIIQRYAWLRLAKVAAEGPYIIVNQEFASCNTLSKINHNFPTTNVKKIPI